VVNLSLDLNTTEKVNLDYLYLDEITVTNWNMCNWKVNKLILIFTPFEDRTNMQIQELIFSDAVMDLSVLPRSLERLTIYSTDEINCSSNQMVVLPHLHFLVLSSLNNDLFSVIFEFVNCSNLVVLDLTARCGEKFIINSDWIPKTVKRVKLNRFLVNWIEGHKDFNLDKLVLIENSVSEIKDLCDTLSQTKEIVLDLKCMDICDTNPTEIEESNHFFEYLLSKINNSNHIRIYAGPCPCLWRSLSITNDDAFSYADTVPELYLVFESQKKKALEISHSEFYESENIVDTEM